MWRRIWYRVTQFFHALTAHASQAEIEQAIDVLAPEVRGLFGRQSRHDQYHALAVWRSLCQAGHSDPQLLSAALLHDVGKAAAQLTPWQRAIIVTLGQFAPSALRRLGSGELSEDDGAAGRRHPFIVHARHAELGACWAREAGCSALTVALIQQHQDRGASTTSEADRLLVALQAADDAN